MSDINVTSPPLEGGPVGTQGNDKMMGEDTTTSQKEKKRILSILHAIAVLLRQALCAERGLLRLCTVDSVGVFSCGTLVPLSLSHTGN